MRDAEVVRVRPQWSIMGENQHNELEVEDLGMYGVAR